jgi:hypothetical protein
MARKKCPKCDSTKIIKKGTRDQNNSTSAESASIGF